MNEKPRRALKVTLSIIIILLLLVASYALYIVLSYQRIDDDIEIAIENEKDAELLSSGQYTITTYNIGFGAYGPEFSFFMDTGHMADGTYVKGKHGKGISKELTIRNTEGAIGELEALDSDIMILQEVDRKSSRAYGVDQYKMLSNAFPGHSTSYASNFHTPYLPYPFHDPHGKTEAGLVMLSRYKVEEVRRRSYPISDSLSKLFDLDRCFTISRLAIDNGKYLVVINSHMSAYDEGGVIRSAQLDMLKSIMSEEYEKGNYVIVGGDFNHILSQEMVDFYPSGQQTPQWIAVLSEEDVPQGFSIAKAVNRGDVSTCRSADIPYEKNVNYTALIDGFIVSDNIEYEVRNIETNYAWSDHQPVEMRFSFL